MGGLHYIKAQPITKNTMEKVNLALCTEIIIGTLAVSFSLLFK